MKKNVKAKLIERIIENTAKFAKANGYVEKPDSSLSKRHQAIVDAVRPGSFGCNQTRVIELVAALTGIAKSNFSNGDTDSNVRLKDHPFASAVPLKLYCSHNYEVNKPMLIDRLGNQSGTGWRYDGKPGNSLLGPRINLRAATKEEIEKLPDVLLECMLKSVIIL